MLRGGGAARWCREAAPRGGAAGWRRDRANRAWQPSLVCVRVALGPRRRALERPDCKHCTYTPEAASSTAGHWQDPRAAGTVKAYSCTGSAGGAKHARGIAWIPVTFGGIPAILGRIPRFGGKTPRFWAGSRDFGQDPAISPCPNRGNPRFCLPNMQNPDYARTDRVFLCKTSGCPARDHGFLRNRECLVQNLDGL